MKTQNQLLIRTLFIVSILSTNLLVSQNNTSPTQTVCAGSLSEPYLINPPTSGSSYQWSISGGGTIIPGTSSDNITVDWGVNPGLYTITVIETDINGCLGQPVTVDVTVNPLPTATIATSQIACLGSSIPSLTAIGANVTWYSDAALTNIVYTGNTFNTGQTAVGLYMYYVTETLNGCEGPSVSVSLEILSIPASPIATSEIACLGGVIPSLSASGNNLTWYSDPALTSIVNTGSNFNTGQTTVGVYTYYVTDTDMNGCESLPSTTTLEILSSPSSPVSSNEIACLGGVVPSLSASGNNLTWYSDPGLTSIVNTGPNFNTGQTTVGVYTYYVTDTDMNGCESLPSTTILEILSLPNSPVSSNEIACLGGVIPSLSASGNNLTWYSDPGLTSIVNTGPNFNTGQTTVGVYTYYVTDTDVNGCESPSTVVTLTINSFTSIPIASPVSACFGSVIPLLTATGIGNSFTWYSDASLTAIVGSNSPFSHGQTGVGLYTFYVTETSLNGCESPPASVTLEIYPLPVTGPINHW